MPTSNLLVLSLGVKHILLVKSCQGESILWEGYSGTYTAQLVHLDAPLCCVFVSKAALAKVFHGILFGSFIQRTRG